MQQIQISMDFEFAKFDNRLRNNYLISLY